MTATPALDPSRPPPIERSGGTVVDGPRSRTWLLVPLVIAVLGGLTLAILSRMPFGGGFEAKSRISAPESRPAPTDSGRIVELDPNDPRVAPNPADTVAPPPVTATPAVPPATTAPESAPTPGDREDEQEVSESDAASALLDYLQSDDIYGVDSACLGLRNLGFVNAGYTFEAMDQCDGERSLGKWRVDSTNGDIYRQRPDGRYLAP